MKQSGMRPSPRCGCALAVFPNSNRAYVFGGVCDDESEETLEGTFYNELYQLELDNGKWHMVTLNRLKNTEKKKQCSVRDPDGGEPSTEMDVDVDVSSTVEQLHLMDTTCLEQQSTQILTSEDGIFTVKIVPQQRKDTESTTKDTDKDVVLDYFVPLPRMNASLVIKHGVLYLYGGIYEEGEKTMTFSDFYSLGKRCHSFQVQ